MTPIIYANNETTFTSLGLGMLPDCVYCKAVEDIESGKIECEFSYPITGVNYSLIVPDRIIKAKPNDTSDLQLFRIYKVSKPINGIVKFYTQHISYDLSMIPIQKINFQSSITQDSLFALLKSKYKLPNNSAIANEANLFTFTNLQPTKSRAIAESVPRSMRAWLGGSDNSFLKVYGGELEFDNFSVKLHETRGSDNGVRISYGKNLTDINADIDIQNTYTTIYAFAVDGNGQYHETTSPVDISNGHLNTYGSNRCLILDLSDQFDNDETITEPDLISKAQSYASEYKLNDPITSISVSFVKLWESKEFDTIKNLERVSIGDTVTVDYPELGISSKLRVVKTVYDCLNEKYISIDLGKAKQTIVKMLSDVNRNVDKIITTQQTEMQAAASYAAQKITGGMGGYVVIKPNASTGYPEEILIMDNPDISQAVKVWRWNSGGLGHSNSGYNSQSYNIALTADGQINASAITTGTLNANLIKAGAITDQSNTVYLGLGDGVLRFSMGSNMILELWSSGVTIKNSVTGKVKTSMFKSTNNEGVITAEIGMFGERDNEKVSINGLNGTINSEGEISAKKFITTDSPYIDTSHLSYYSVIDTNGATQYVLGLA